MASLTDDTAANIINALLRGNSFSPPTSYWVALFTTSPGDDGTGGVEVSGTGYARVELANDSASFSDPGTTRTTTNEGAIEFPPIEAAWGEVVAVGLYDADTAGTLWMKGAISPSKNVTLGQNPLQFAPGDLQFSLI